MKIYRKMSFESVFPSYQQSRHSTVEAFLQGSSTGHANLLIILSTRSSSSPFAQVLSSCAPWTPSQWHQPKHKTVSCPLTSLVFIESLLGTRLSQRPCCQVEAHGIFWGAAALSRASHGMLCPVISCPHLSRFQTPFNTSFLYWVKI